ncbi:MAG: dihydrolipoyl dehydrogenase [Desulfomonile sp.]|nr:dihydrolipoyl dehydrogenase [Desulfomonile sp.]
MPDHYDMAIIGAGPGGYMAALKGRALGLSVALIEKERLGGVCLNRGCIPTKAILSDMEGVRWMQRAAQERIIDAAPRIDYAHIVRRKNGAVDTLVTSLSSLLAERGVQLLPAAARIAEPGHIRLESGETIRSRSIVIATGSRSWTPPIPGADLPGVMGTREILDLETPPSRLVVVGGGIIGQEFAAIFATLGAKVTVLEALGRVMQEVDTEFARKYVSLLPARGVTTEVGVAVHRIERAGDLLRVVYEKRAAEKTVEADVVLMATGRRPFLEGLGVEELGIATDRGSIQVDERLSTNVDGIYAIGDVVGRRMLAHVASYHGEIVAEIIAGRDRKVDDSLVPGAVFTMPQIAWVGLTEDEAVQRGYSFRTSTFSLSASGKAQASGESRGWVKLLAEADTKRLLGAHLMGPHVSELLGELTLAIRKGMTAADIVDTIHPHPTISEALREAAAGFLDGPFHAAPRIKNFSSTGSPSR